MRDANEIMRERQKHVRRQIDDRGISLKAVAFDANRMSYSSLLSYFPGNQDAQPAVMPMSALFDILSGNALPRDLVSLLLPDGDAIVRIPEGVDHDAVEGACREYLRAKGDAHKAESPAGREISQCEDSKLGEKVVELRAAVAA